MPHHRFATTWVWMHMRMQSGASGLPNELVMLAGMCHTCYVGCCPLNCCQSCSWSRQDAPSVLFLFFLAGEPYFWAHAPPTASSWSDCWSVAQRAPPAFGLTALHVRGTLMTAAESSVDVNCPATSPCQFLSEPWVAAFGALSLALFTAFTKLFTFLLVVCWVASWLAVVGSKVWPHAC